MPQATEVDAVPEEKLVVRTLRCPYGDWSIEVSATYDKRSGQLFTIVPDRVEGKYQKHFQQAHPDKEFQSYC